MAYDESLAERVRVCLGNDPDVTERKMFGGIGFMLRGNMAIGVSGDELMVRVGEDGHDEAIASDGVRLFEMAGRSMRGWVLVSQTAIAEAADLAHWVDVGLEYAGALPPK